MQARRAPARAATLPAKAASNAQPDASGSSGSDRDEDQKPVKAPAKRAPARAAKLPAVKAAPKKVTKKARAQTSESSSRSSSEEDEDEDSDCSQAGKKSNQGMSGSDAEQDSGSDMEEDASDAAMWDANGLRREVQRIVGRVEGQPKMLIVKIVGEFVRFSCFLFNVLARESFVAIPASIEPF